MHKRFKQAELNVLKKETSLAIKNLENKYTLTVKYPNALAQLYRLKATVELFDKKISLNIDLFSTRAECNVHKCQDVSLLLKLFTFHGFVLSDKEERISDDLAWVNLNGHFNEMPLQVSIFLGTQNSCRKVQVGTMEKPVYEIQCEDGTSLEDIIEQAGSDE